MRRRALLMSAAIAAAVAVPTIGATALGPPLGPPLVPPSPTPPTHLATVSPSNPIVTFSGAVQNPTPLPLVDPPAPVVCAVNCQEFAVNLDSTDPFLVSVKNTVTGPGGTFNANDGFDLYVYGPAGTLIAAGNGIGANGQSLEINTQQKGSYTLVVTFTYAEDPNAAYLGEVRLMKPPSWQPPACTQMTVGSVSACFELPKLQALPAYDLAVSGVPPVASTPLGFPFPVSTPTTNSCYLDESLGLDNPSPSSIQNPITRCLRFTSDVQDTGAGAAEVRIPLVANGSSGPAVGYLPGQCQAEQVLTTSSGQQVFRPAGSCEFHPEHAHFHYGDLLAYGLYNIGSDGVSVGALVSKSHKESFCLSDDDYFGFGSAGPNPPNGPRQFVGQPGCNLPAQVDATGAFVDEGVSPGWGDVYTWDTPDQFIDISNVGAGDYYLIEQTNPTGSILVQGDPLHNNSQQSCALTKLQLDATSVKELSTASGIQCPS